MKYLAFILLVTPLFASAQLSSENFQVDSFSVGGTQSISADSTNFTVTQEPGGLFVVEDERESVSGTSGGGMRRRVVTDTTDTTETARLVEDEQGQNTEPPGATQMAPAKIFTNTEGQTSGDDSGLLPVNQTQELEPEDEIASDSLPILTFEIKQNNFLDVAVNYFWYWWWVVLGLAGYCVHIIARRL